MMNDCPKCSETMRADEIPEICPECGREIWKEMEMAYGMPIEEITGSARPSPGTQAGVGSTTMKPWATRSSSTPSN